MSRSLVLVVGSLLFLGCGDDDDDGGDADVSVSLACDLNVEFEQAGKSASSTVCIYSSCMGPASTCTTDDANCLSLATQVSAQDGVTATASEVSSCSTKPSVVEFTPEPPSNIISCRERPICTRV